MRVRDSWLLEDFSFDEPTDWATAPEVQPMLRHERTEDERFRSLLEDPEACWQWGAR